MRTAGFNFSIGARIASTVGSAFNTVSGRMSTLRGELRQLNSMSTAANRLTSRHASLTALRARAAAGEDVRDSLNAAERAYAAAERAAARYGISIADAARIQAQAAAQIARTEAALRRQQSVMRNTARRQELQGEIMGTVASAGMIIAPIKMAIDFESSMADAAKTIDGMRDSAGNLTKDYYAMEKAVKQMGRELPLTHTEIAGLFAAGGQMGKSNIEDLKEFTTLSAHMAVSFGMDTQAAADAIGGYQTKLGLSAEQVREMLDLTNQFANTSSAKEKDIAGIVSRVGALGDIAGVAYKPMTAMAATLAAMKIPEEIAATGLKNFMLAMTKGDAATKTQSESFAKLGIDVKKLSIQMQEDSEGAMLAVLESIKALPAHQQTGILTQIFGSESVLAIAPLLKELDLLKENFALAGDSASFAGAMQKEFENRAKTTANNIILMKNKMAELAITAGNSLLPAFNQLLDTVGRGAMVMATFADANPEVVKVVMYTVSALVAFKVATLLGGYALTIVSDVWRLARGAWAIGAAMCNRATYAMAWQRVVSLTTAAGLKIVTAAQWALNVAMSNNPIGWIISGVVALGAGLVYLYKNCEPVRKALDWLWDGIISGLKPVISMLETVWGGIKSVGSWFSSDEAKEIELKTTGASLATQSTATSLAENTPEKSTGWFSGWFGDDDEDKGLKPVQSMKTAASAMPDTSDPNGLPDNMPLPASFMAQNGLPSNSSGNNGGINMPATLNMTINIHGIPDKDMSQRVMDSLRSKSSEIESFLGELLKNQERVTYG